MQVRALVGLHGMGRWEGQGGDYMSSSEVSCPISVGNVPLIDVPDKSLYGGRVHVNRDGQHRAIW